VDEGIGNIFVQIELLSRMEGVFVALSFSTYNNSLESF